jgi:hypothetical protein
MKTEGNWPYEGEGMPLDALLDALRDPQGRDLMARDTQVAGKHYKKYPIQPFEYNQKNELRYCEGNVVKYVTRHRDKYGKEDLLKAKHYIDLLIELEYGGG